MEQIENPTKKDPFRDTKRYLELYKTVLYT